MDKQVILFDLDGTLVDSFPGISQCVLHALDSMNFLVENPREFTARFVGPPLLESFMRYCDFSEEQAHLAVTRYREKFSVEGVFNFTPYPGVQDLVRDLKAAGKTVALATSKPTVFAKKIIHRMGLDASLDFISGCELDGTRMHKVEVIQYALAQLSITDKSSVLMIGDREHDIYGATAAGVDCAAVLYGYGNREEFLHAGALEEWIVESVGDLRSLLLGQ